MLRFKPMGGDKIVRQHKYEVIFIPGQWSTVKVHAAENEEGRVSIALEAAESSPRECGMFVRARKRLFARFGVDCRSDAGEDLAFLLATSGRGRLWEAGKEDDVEDSLDAESKIG